MKWFDRLSTRNKLAVIFCLVVMVTATLIAWNGFSTVRMTNTAVNVANQFEQADVPLSAITSLRRLQISELDFLRTKDSQYLYAHDQETHTLDQLIHVELLKTNDVASRSRLYEFWRDQAEYVDRFETAVATMNNNTTELPTLLEASFVHLNSMLSQLTPVVNERLVELERMGTIVLVEQIVASVISLLGIFFFVWLAVSILRIMNRNINQPLGQLTQAATAVTNQQFNPDSLTELATRQDEFGQLARSFLQMQTAVAQREAQRQQKIDDLRRRIAQMD